MVAVLVTRRVRRRRRLRQAAQVVAELAATPVPGPAELRGASDRAAITVLAAGALAAFLAEPAQTELQSVE